MLQFTLSRRLVLGGLAAFAGAHELVKTRVELPTLWGDMLHDDAPALNALFSGKPVRIVSGRAVSGAAPALLDARCLIASTVHVTVDDALLARVELKAAPGFCGHNLIRFTGDRVVLTNSHFNMGASVAALGGGRMTPREEVVASMPGAWIWRQLCAGRSMAEIAEGVRVTVEELDIAVWRYRTERTGSRAPTRQPKASPPRRFSWQQPEQRA